MKFVETVDYGDAPTYFANGIASVTTIAPGVIEVALYRAVENHDGGTENRIVSRMIWALEQWNEAGLVAAQAKAAMQSGAHPAGAGKPTLATSH